MKHSRHVSRPHPAIGFFYWCDDKENGHCYYPRCEDGVKGLLVTGGGASEFVPLFQSGKC